jgi:hypothetical protein
MWPLWLLLGCLVLGAMIASAPGVPWRLLSRARLRRLAWTVSMIARRPQPVCGPAGSLLLGRAGADQPAVDLGKQFAAVVVQAGIGTHGLKDTRGLRGARGLVAEQPREGPGVEVEQLFELGDDVQVRGALAFLPLPHRAGGATDRAGDGTLRQPRGLPCLPQGVAELFPLLASTAHGGSMPDPLSPCRGILVAQVI